MKKNEIKVGWHYLAKISGKLTTVRVDAIRESEARTSTPWSGSGSRSIVIYDVTNLSTGRKTTFRSAAKFRQEVKPPDPQPSTLSQPSGCAGSSAMYPTIS